MRRFLVSVSIVLLVFTCSLSATAALVEYTVQGLTFTVEVPGGPTTNTMNEAVSSIDDSSASRLTGVTTAGGTIGVAFNPWDYNWGTSQPNIGVGAHTGGIFEFNASYYAGGTPNPNFPNTSDPVREVTGRLFGLQLFGMEWDPATTTVHAGAGGSINLQMTSGSETVTLLYTADPDAGFDIHSDDSTIDPTTSNLSLGDSTNFDNVNLQTGATGGNPDWDAATDDAYVESLMEGTLMPTTYNVNVLDGRIAADLFGVALGPQVAGIVAAITFTFTGMNQVGVTAQVEGTLDNVYLDVTAGALDGYILPYTTPPPGSGGQGSLTAPAVYDARGFASRLHPANGVGMNAGQGPLWATAPFNIVTGWGGAYAAFQPLGAEPELADDLMVEFQLPLPSSAAFMAPAFVGFAFYAIRRRRRT